MKNKLIYLLFLSLIFTGCSKKSTRIIETSDNLENSNISSNVTDNNISNKVSDDPSFIIENIEENKLSEEDYEQDSKVDDKNLLTSYGSYGASLVDKSREGWEKGYVDYVKFENGYLIFSGILNYNEEMTGSFGDSTFDEGVYKFKLDPNVKIMAKSGLAKPEMMNEEEFINYLEKCRRSGLGFVVNVDNSMAYEVIISS